MSDEQKHWLVRPESIRKLWIGFIVVLGLTVLADFAIKKHGHFTLENSFAFNAWYGFAACVSMVLITKLLAFLLKRKDSYYEE